jgi:hypothetical protein
MARGPNRPATTLWAVAAALAIVVIGAIGAVRAAVTGADFMFDLEEPRSALARAEPRVLDPGTPRLARRVVLIIVDGLRADASQTMPTVARLRTAGVSGTATSHYPSWSRPNYVSILTGVPPQASGVRTNRHYTPVVLDTLMDRARAAGLRVASASDNSPLPVLFLRPVDSGAAGRARGRRHRSHAGRRSRRGASHAGLRAALGLRRQPLRAVARWRGRRGPGPARRRRRAGGGLDRRGR